MGLFRWKYHSTEKKLVRKDLEKYTKHSCRNEVRDGVRLSNQLLSNVHPFTVLPVTFWFCYLIKKTGSTAYLVGVRVK